MGIPGRNWDEGVVEIPGRAWDDGVKRILNLVRKDTFVTPGSTRGPFSCLVSSHIKTCSFRLFI